MRRAMAAMAAMAMGCDEGEDTGSPPGCELLEPGDRLVFDGGCIDGLCGGTPWPDAVALWGEPETCGVESRMAVCTWDGQRTVNFPDCDDDGLPDSEDLCDQYDQRLRVHDGWSGASAEGLGLGVQETCFTEQLGPEEGWRWGQAAWVWLLIESEEGVVQAIELRWSLEE